MVKMLSGFDRGHVRVLIIQLFQHKTTEISEVFNANLELQLELLSLVRILIR